MKNLAKEMSNRINCVRVLLILAGVALAGWLLSVLESNRVKIGVGSIPDVSLSTTNATCFMATVVNRSVFDLKIEDIQFAWRDEAGRISNCVMVSSWRTALNPGCAVVARAMIPVEAQSFRVCVVWRHGRPLLKLAAKLPRGRYAWLDSVLAGIDGGAGPRLNSHFGPWMPITRLSVDAADSPSSRRGPGVLLPAITGR